MKEVKFGCPQCSRQLFVHSMKMQNNELILVSECEECDIPVHYNLLNVIARLCNANAVKGNNTVN